MTLINLVLGFTTLKSMKNENGKKNPTPCVSSSAQNLVWIKSQIKIQMDQWFIWAQQVEEKKTMYREDKKFFYQSYKA